MNILNLSAWQVLEVIENGHDYLVSAEPLHQTDKCQSCYGKELYKHGIREQIYMHLPMHGKRVGIKANVQRFQCRKCQKVFQQNLPDIHDDYRATKQLVIYIQQQSLRKTFVEIANEVGFDETTIRKIFRNYSQELERSNQFMTPKWLGIDEIHIRRTPRLILTNIAEQTIYDLYPSRKQEKVAKYLSNIPNKETIQLVAMDMWLPYKNAVKAILPKAKIIIDKFHVVRMANKAVDDYRKSLSSNLSQTERRAMMRSRYILLKRKKDLSEEDKFQLDIWTSNLAMLGLAHELKESFYKIYEAKDRHEAARRFWDWQLSVPKELEATFNDLIRAVKNWESEIFNYFDHRITNAFTESINSVIRKHESAGRGYSFEAVRTKILYTQGFKKVKKPRFNRNLNRNMNSSSFYVIEPWGNQQEVTNYGVPISTFLENFEKGEF